MTSSQEQAVWELCRQGFPLAAEEAAAHWEKGEAYQPDLGVRVPREVKHLIDCSNWEMARVRGAGQRESHRLLP
jgi:hypothetical protein